MYNKKYKITKRTHLDVEMIIKFLKSRELLIFVSFDFLLCFDLVIFSFQTIFMHGNSDLLLSRNI